MSYERIARKETESEAEIAAIRANVKALPEEAEGVDAAEDERYGPDGRGDELPVELQRREQRLAAIREAKQALEVEAAGRETERQAFAETGDLPRTPTEVKCLPIAKCVHLASDAVRRFGRNEYALGAAPPAFSCSPEGRVCWFLLVGPVDVAESRE